MKKIVSAILSFMLYISGSAQTMTVEEYIATYKDIAISEMKRSGIPASITLAQGILETENGNSDLVKRSNNHFGIKCKSNWTGETVSHDDDALGECFRKYDKAEDSYRDHSNFLRGSTRYAFLFELKPSDYKGWAYGLKKAGYATNPRYPDILIKNIETNNLQQYDMTDGVVVIPVDNATTTETKPVDISASNEMNTAKNLESIKAGKTRFNGLKAVFAPKGVSLLAIATEFDIPLASLLEFNDLKEDGLLKDEQWIFLEKKMKEGNRDFYIAGSGETLYDISQTNAIQLASLMEFNNLRDQGLVKKGTKIRLRQSASIDTDKKSSIYKVHQVQPKEGLYAISKKYNVTVEDLKLWNGLSDNELKIGQELIISK